ncbi:WD40 repeat-like protein [Aulographum hederae CBS 113979]|uniref:WD40 repeat-like protein n=1 Tax=Aulographum hederae CBS 113979 TaxID=1176131 RepID=A0A6G1GJA1_9PEZI|nr:WD40 repeat-like protein [Aulographum hederae CBS 113979]
MATVKTTFEAGTVIQPIHTGGSVALSQDGKILATCVGEDALLTDLRTGKELARIQGDGETITTSSLTPSASHLIICSRSLSMRIFQLRPSAVDDGTIDTILERTLKPHSSPVIVSTVDHTGTLLATGGADGVVKVWDIRGGYTTHTFHGHSGVISALHFFELDASALQSEISQKSKKKRKQDDVLQEEAASSTFGFRLASGGEDGHIRIWNLHKRTSVAMLDSHVSVVRSLNYSSHENTLVSSSRDKTVIVWDARTWTTKTVIPVLEAVESTGFLSEGGLIYTGGENGVVRVWNSSGGTEITKEQEHGGETDRILQIIRHDSLPYLLSIYEDNSLVLHSTNPLLNHTSSKTIPPLPVLRRISGTHDEIIDLAYVGSDSNLLALATNSEDIRIISIAPSSSSSSDNDLVGGNYFGADVALLSGHDDIIICIDTDWSGHWLATGAKDNTARLWRLDPESDSYSCFAIFTGHAESLGAIALPHSTPSADSPAFLKPLDHPPAFLITGSQDKTVKRWDTSSVSGPKRKAARAAYTRKAHDKDINAIDTNDKGTLFASASQDRTVKIWSVEDGQITGTLRGHRRGVWSVKFSPKDLTGTVSGAGGAASVNKGLILTGCGDKTVRIWSLLDYSCLLTFEGHTNSVLKVVWLPPPSTEDARGRGILVASAGGDGLVKVWDATSGEVAATLDNHTDRVWALAVPPRRRIRSQGDDASSAALISGAADAVLTFWQDTTSATALEASTAATKTIEQDQRLANLSLAGNYREAIVLALQLDRPARLLGLLKNVVEGEERDDDAISGKPDVDEALKTLSDEQLWKLLRWCREWNGNARTAGVAQRVLSILVRTYPAERFVKLRRKGGGVGKDGKGKPGDIGDVLRGLKAYGERHARRVEAMIEESYLLEFTLREMDEVFGSVAGEEIVRVNGHPR